MMATWRRVHYPFDYLARSRTKRKESNTKMTDLNLRGRTKILPRSNIKN